MKPTGPTNAVTAKLVEDIRSQGHKEKNKFKLELARLLLRHERKVSPVNIAKIQRVCKDGEVIVVPAKVLSTGEIEKKITIYAKSYSEQAKAKIKKSGGEAFLIQDLLKENPKGSKVRIMV